MEMLVKLGFVMVLVTIANAMIDDENDVLQKMTRTSTVYHSWLCRVLYIQHVYNII